MRRFSSSTFIPAAIAGLCAIGALAWPAAAPAQNAPAATAQKVPDLSGVFVRQARNGIAAPSTFEMPTDPKLRPGPPMNTVTGERAGVEWIADSANPLLLPWNAEYLKKRGERELVDVNNVSWNICWPSGVPQVTLMREPLQLLQEPNMVTMIYQRDHTVRRVYLNEKLPEKLTPSWFGHSVGHYEGDTLVIETAGLNAKTGIDRFNTQHTEQLRVEERYELVENGQFLRVILKITDPGAFTAPFYAQAHYRRQPQTTKFEEVACAENNRDVTTGGGLGEFPIPKDDTPDF